jgi:hypothetical protein
MDCDPKGLTFGDYNSDDEFEVEKIMDWRLVKNGGESYTESYLIKWLGYEDLDWLPVQFLKVNGKVTCERLLRDFYEETHKKRFRKGVLEYGGSMWGFQRIELRRKPTFLPKYVYKRGYNPEPYGGEKTITSGTMCFFSKNMIGNSVNMPVVEVVGSNYYGTKYMIKFQNKEDDVRNETRLEMIQRHALGGNRMMRQGYRMVEKSSLVLNRLVDHREFINGISNNNF